jgi:hypothetical protein
VPYRADVVDGAGAGRAGASQRGFSPQNVRRLGAIFTAFAKCACLRYRRCPSGKTVARCSARFSGCHVALNRLQTPKIACAQKLISPGNSISSNPSPHLREEFCFRFSETCAIIALSRLDKRGVRPIVTEREAGCDGRDSCARRARPTRTVKPCGPVPPTLGSSLSMMIDKATEANKPGTPGRARSSRKAIAQGVPDVSAYLYRLVGIFPFQSTRPAGAASARHSLRPLLHEGRE